MAHDEKQSLWKKEISFRRKPSEARDPGEPAAEPAADVSEAGTSSIWKKEISLRRKPKEPEQVDEPVAAEPEPEPVPEPVAPLAPAAAPPAAVEHDWLTQPLEEVSEPPLEPVAELPVPSAPVTLVPVADAPTLVPVPDPVPLPEPEPVPAPAFELPAAVELPVLPDPAAPELELPEPAPAAEAPAKVPFYRKELTFKRTPKDERPKRAKPEKQPKEQRAKRALPFSRAPKQWDDAEPAVAAKPKLTRVPRPKPSLPRLGGSSKSIVGLKIGGSQIAAARVDNGATPELLQAVREPLEHGIVVNGELRDPEALAAALRTFFSRNKLPKRGVRLGIANNRIGVRTFEVVGIADPKQLANAIRFRAQEVLPIPIEEAVLDYQVLGESVNDEGQPVRRVLLVVAYRELVDRYLLACRKAGLQVVGIDLEAFALLRAVSEPHDPLPGVERGAVVAVSVGHDRSTFAVSDGRICEFTRVLEWGGWALNVAIARALDSSPSEVEPLKRALSLAGPEELPEGFTAEQLGVAREAARRQLQTFARELVSSLQFYQNQPGSLGIGEIAVTGGTAHLPGLGAELERLIGVPVRIADPLARVKVSKKVREREQVGSLAVAIGLGIED